MTRRFAAVVLLTLCSLTAGAAVDFNDPALKPGLDAVRPEAMRSTVEFLADDLLEGREAGQRGYDLAARWVASQFEALGLEPGGEQGSWYQTVRFRTSRVDPEKSSLALVSAGKEQPLKFPDDYVLYQNYSAPETTVDAPLVFVGYGVSAPEFNYDDYAGADVRGKIIVLFRGAPSAFPHNERAYYSSSQTKYMNAVAHGAVGVIQVRTALENKRTPWERAGRFAREIGMKWLEADGTPHNVYSQVRIGGVLSPKVAERIFSGSGTTFEKAMKAAEAGKGKAVPLAYSLRGTTVSTLGTATSPNVAGIVRGSDPQLRDEYVVYTAHLDHEGIGPEVKGDRIYNGAYDNATGIAALIEVARAFRAMPEPPRRSIIFLAVTAEEKGLLGSDYYANNPTVPKPSIVANLNMDMFLALFPLKDLVAFGAEHSSLGPLAAAAAARMNFTLSPDFAPEEVVFVRSDQYSFVKQGIPSLYLDAGEQPANPGIEGREKVMEWLRNVYHTPADEADQPFDWPTLARFAQTNFLIGYAVAGESARPAWNPGDFFGSRFGAAQATATGSSGRP